MTFLDIFAGLVAAVMILAGCALDSSDPAPLMVCGLCMCWLIFYSILKGEQEE